MKHSSNSSPRVVLLIALLVIAIAWVILHASPTHGTTFADPAACKPGYIVRAVRQGLPRCTRAVYVPRGVK